MLYDLKSDILSVGRVSKDVSAAHPVVITYISICMRSYATLLCWKVFQQLDSAMTL